MTLTGIDILAFVAKMQGLLDLERDAEIERTTSEYKTYTLLDLQRRGVCIMDLNVTDVRSANYIRSDIYTMQRFPIGRLLPANKFSIGDVVQIIATDNGVTNQNSLMMATVTRVTDKQLCIAVSESVERYNIRVSDDSADAQRTLASSGIKYHVTKCVSNITYQRMKDALTRLVKADIECEELVQVLFFKQAPRLLANTVDELEYQNPNLNECQKIAVESCLNQRNVAIVHGPPGTGKTTTVVEAICQLVALDLKVLVCAPSNVAVDNLVEKLAYQDKTGPRPLNLVRLGHPARVQDALQRHAFDVQMGTFEGDGELLHELRRKISKLIRDIQNVDEMERGAIWKERRELQKDLRLREERLARQIMSNADVVLCTLASATREGPMKYLPKGREHFDVVVIDECSQALEAQCWQALLLAPKCILAGDHMQLPPTIVSEKASASGLSITLMERLVKCPWGKIVTTLLCTQYRMHQDIMEWSSTEFYESKLEPDESVAQHLLS